MNAKWSLLGLIFAGAIAALCAVVLVAAIQAKSGREPKSQEVAAAIATQDLPAGMIIRQDHVEKVVLSSSEAPEGALSPAEVIGSVLLNPIVKGETFKADDLMRKGERQELASALPDGMRAVSVTLSEDAGLRGMIYKGSRVDVLATFDARSSSGTDPTSITLLESVLVLAVDGETIVSGDDDTRKPSTNRDRKMIITFMLNSQQAQALQLATENGSISLAMRSPTDAGEVEGEPMALSDLAGGKIDALASMLSEIQENITRRLDEATAGSQPEPAGPVAVPEAKPAEPAPSRWVTTVIRGKTTQRILFSDRND